VGEVQVSDSDGSESDDALAYAGLWEDEDEPDTAWNDALRVEQAVQAIRARYEAKARPLLATQRRNGGVRLPQLAQLDLACEREIEAVLRAHELAVAYERAARDASTGRAQARAHERQRGAQNLAALAQDLGRGRRTDAPEPPGRSVRDAWSW
jgi:hypothetical protein